MVIVSVDVVVVVVVVVVVDVVVAAIKAITATIVTTAMGPCRETYQSWLEFDRECFLR